MKVGEVLDRLRAEGGCWPVKEGAIGSSRIPAPTSRADYVEVG